MSRLKFGAFLAPHHPIGEHPTLQFQRDLELVEHLDRLGFDEFWCGEHHSTGWEVIASPEMFPQRHNAAIPFAWVPAWCRYPTTIPSMWLNVSCNWIT